jgi:ADP-ribose pyrophosphatase
MPAAQTVFSGKLLRVVRCPVRLPNGYKITLELIKHPGAVLIVPILNDGSIVFIRQYRPAIASYIWELPAGTLKAGEKPAVCAQRELIEETGYRAGSLKKLGFIYPAPGYTTEKILIFSATKLLKVPAQQEADEVITVVPKTPAQVRNLLKIGKIVDAKTICALALLKGVAI